MAAMLAAPYLKNQRQNIQVKKTGMVEVEIMIKNKLVNILTG